MFDKRVLGQSRWTGGGSVPPNQKLFLISFIYIKKKIFFKKDTFNEVSDLHMLHLSKVDFAKGVERHRILISCNHQEIISRTR